jgi:hypothetical protein
MDKAHLLVDANSSRVGLKRQEWDTALGMNVARDCGDKSLSIAGAAEVRVCRRHALPRSRPGPIVDSHFGEAAIDANPHEPAPRLAVWSRNGQGSVRLARFIISGKSVDVIGRIASASDGRSGPVGQTI